MVGMQILSINNMNVDGLTSGQAVQILKDCIGQILVVADNPIQATVVASSSLPMVPVLPPVSKENKLKYMILKKMNNYTPMETSLPTVTSYSFHGPMTQDMADYVNYKLQKLLISPRANILQFDMDIYGRFIGRMNNEALIIHEEDFLVVILEAMKVYQ